MSDIERNGGGAPASLGTALARAKKLREEGKDDEANELLESFFARTTAEKEEAERQAAIATENLRRATAKKGRYARTHQPKTMPRPSEDPIYLREYRGKTLTPAVMVSLARFAASELGIDCGPPRDGYRGVPQRGSHGGPVVTFADWIEQEITRTPDDLPGAADRAAARLERKLDALVLVAKEYQQRAWRIAALLVEVDRHGGDVEAASTAVLRYPWAAVYDADAVGAESTSEPTAAWVDDEDDASITRGQSHIAGGLSDRREAAAGRGATNADAPHVVAEHIETAAADDAKTGTEAS